MRGSIRRLRAAVSEGDKPVAEQALKHAIKLLDKAVTKGILVRRTASRNISRLTGAVQKM